MLDSFVYKELAEIKTRLSQLEKEIFGMDHEDAQAVVNSYVAAAQENPYIEASSAVKKAEKMLGV